MNFRNTLVIHYYLCGDRIICFSKTITQRCWAQGCVEWRWGKMVKFLLEGNDNFGIEAWLLTTTVCLKLVSILWSYWKPSFESEARNPLIVFEYPSRSIYYSRISLHFPVLYYIILYRVHFCWSWTSPRAPVTLFLISILVLSVSVHISHYLCREFVNKVIKVLYIHTVHL